MNPYDFSYEASDIPKTFGYQKGLATLRRMHLTQLWVVLMGVLGLWALLFRPFDLPAEPVAYGLITICTMVFGVLVYYAGVLSRARRIRRCGPQVAHDYDYALYRKTSPKRRAAKSLQLLILAKYDLLCGDPRQAQYALALVQPELLSKERLKTFSFYQATAAQFLGDFDAAEAALERCRAVPVSGTDYPTEEILDTLFQPDTSNEALMDAVETWGPVLRQGHPGLLRLGAFLLLYFGWFTGVRTVLLDGGYEFRMAFGLGSQCVLWTGFSLLVMTCAILLIRRISCRPGRSFLRSILGIAATFCLASLLLFFGLSWLTRESTSWPSAEFTLEDNALLLCQQKDPGYAYRISVSPILQRVPTSEEEQMLLTRYGPAASAYQEIQESQFPAVSDASPEASASSAGASSAEPQPEVEYGSDDARWRTEALAICETAHPESDPDAVTFAYTAKGSFYALFPETDGESGTERLVYDRVSENGLCDLFVLYRDDTDETGSTSTAIVEFYAVNRNTGEVIPGEKRGWADAGSDAYREATGE